MVMDIFNTLIGPCPVGLEYVLYIVSAIFVLYLLKIPFNLLYLAIDIVENLGFSTIGKRK
mgnify:CR=1 FL=1